MTLDLTAMRRAAEAAQNDQERVRAADARGEKLWGFIHVAHAFQHNWRPANALALLDLIEAQKAEIAKVREETVSRVLRAFSDARAELATLRAKLEEAKRTRAKAEKLFEECSIARDEVGWLGHPADTIRGMGIECDEQRTRAERAETALAQAGVVTEEMKARAVAAFDVFMVPVQPDEDGEIDIAPVLKRWIGPALEAALNTRKEG